MDKEECNEIVETGVSNMPCNDEHQHSDEACSPFCSCACCGQIFTPGFILNKMSVVKPAAQKQLYFYTNVYLASSYFGNIWQPPKFS